MVKDNQSDRKVENPEEEAAATIEAALVVVLKMWSAEIKAEIEEDKKVVKDKMLLGVLHTLRAYLKAFTLKEVVSTNKKVKSLR